MKHRGIELGGVVRRSQSPDRFRWIMCERRLLGTIEVVR